MGYNQPQICYAVGMKSSHGNMTANCYQLKVKEHLDPLLSARLGDFAMLHTPDGTTLLTGVIVDQAALHGVLARCRDLGLTLISLNPYPNQ
jgi:hypothetical protein